MPELKMNEAYICEAVRTPIGRYAGSLSTVRPDDLGAHVIKKPVAQFTSPARGNSRSHSGMCEPIR